MRLSDIKTETVHAKGTWVVELSRQGWPRSDRYYQYDSYDEAFAKAKRFLDRYSTHQYISQYEQSNRLNSLRNTGQAQLFEPSGSFFGWVKLYRGTAPLRGSITRILQRRGMNEYFGQTGGINQVSSYVGTGTSGQSLTPKEKRQLAKSKSKRRDCGDKCPCLDCRTKDEERIDWVRSHYNEAYGYDKLTMGVWLKPIHGFELEDLHGIADILAEEYKVDYQGIDHDAYFFTVDFVSADRVDALGEAQQFLKRLRRLGRGKPSFVLDHHQLQRHNV